MKFVYFHGSFGYPEENWVKDLRDKLVKDGHVFEALQYPVDTWEEITSYGEKGSAKKQKLTDWLKVFESKWDFKNNREDLVFIGHSSGPLFILHILEQFNIRIDSAVFVCPFYEKLNTLWQIEKVLKTFYKSNFDFDKIKSQMKCSFSIYSDNDPYVLQQLSENFADELNSTKILYKGAKHINESGGLTKLPIVYELCKMRIGV